MLLVQGNVPTGLSFKITVFLSHSFFLFPRVLVDPFDPVVVTLGEPCGMSWIVVRPLGRHQGLDQHPGSLLPSREVLGRAFSSLSLSFLSVKWENGC